MQIDSDSLLAETIGSQNPVVTERRAIAVSDYTRFSPRASLMALGYWMQEHKVWETVCEQVDIKQKVVIHTPLDKLKDAFIDIVAGGHGLVEVNTRVRSDAPLQRAFGRSCCAEQSVVSATLNACQGQDVAGMRVAHCQLVRRCGRAYAHDYDQVYQLLDVDLTGLPAGRKGEGSTKGFFSERKYRRGRQAGRVFATLYDEIIVERLYPGNTRLRESLYELVEAGEETLGLDEARRARTITRVDGGGGTDRQINWLLARGYQVIAKVQNWQRSVKLAQSVQQWHQDPKHPSRDVGWVESPHAYVRPTRQVAVRKRKKDGRWNYRILVFTLDDETLFALHQRSQPTSRRGRRTLYAAVHLYDLRGGGVETSIRGSKQGLGLTKRNKRRFCAQEMLCLLAQLAYNVLTWVHRDTTAHHPKLCPFGKLRLVRDVFQIPGRITLDKQGRILMITLNEAHPYAAAFVESMKLLLCRDDLVLNLGQI